MTAQLALLPDEAGTKKCPRCGDVKPFSDFGRSSKSGLQCYCKICNARQSSERYFQKHGHRDRRRNIDFDAKTRACSRCREWKPWSAFDMHKHKGVPHSYCHPCRTVVHREKRLKNPERYRQIERKSEYRSRYGMTIAQYEEMLAGQGGKCKICGSTRSGRKSGHFLVDHDHSTGRVRGLLCARCNVGLGNFDDDLDRMHRAMRYVETGGVL